MFFSLLLSSAVFAGNKDRIGQNGANELSINPWTRSAGFANANSTSVIGLESLASNISGLAFTPKTEIQYGFTRFMGGASNINTFGLAQKVGEEAVEVVIEAKDENDDLFLNESADLLFHYLILLQAKGFKLDAVIEVLKSRH
jgi:phosphoribosyl-ATP pyrophosphohydrolase/phosphoribosyl-AMP cyclohydrolase